MYSIGKDFFLLRFILLAMSYEVKLSKLPINCKTQGIDDITLTKYYGVNAVLCLSIIFPISYVS